MQSHPFKWKLLTLADLRNQTSEEKAEHERHSRSEEACFRRGFYDGVDAVLEALDREVTPRQLRVWRDTFVFDWRFHHGGNLGNRLRTPEQDIPEPWKKIRARILQRDGGICQYCEAKATDVDHIIPVYSLGLDIDDNLVACCGDCNIRKKHHPIYDFLGEDEAYQWLADRGLVIRSNKIFREDGNTQ